VCRAFPPTHRRSRCGPRRSSTPAGIRATPAARGVEFYATREYRRGDPLSRVDWKRTARTGDLTTVDFRVERTVRVALVFDTRRSAHLAPSPHEPSAVERLCRRRDDGLRLADAGRPRRRRRRRRTGRVLARAGPGRHSPRGSAPLPGDSSALSPTPPADDTNVYRATQRLKRRLTAETQVVLFSPLHDDLLADTVARPTPTATPLSSSARTPPQRTQPATWSRGERRLRIADLRSPQYSGRRLAPRRGPGPRPRPHPPAVVAVTVDYETFDRSPSPTGLALTVVPVVVAAALASAMLSPPAVALLAVLVLTVGVYGTRPADSSPWAPSSSSARCSSPAQPRPRPRSSWPARARPSSPGTPGRTPSQSADVGAAADTRRLEVVHALATTGVAAVVGIVGFGAFRLASGGQPTVEWRCCYSLRSCSAICSIAGDSGSVNVRSDRI